MLNIKSIPAFNDNYIWVIENREGSCAIVDPGDAKPVLDYLRTNELDLKAILITHHHNDHIGGISELLREYGSVNVVGPESEAIPSITHSVKDDDSIELFGETFNVIDIKGHTSGHIGYFGSGMLFCGDVLFSAGCGRVFEGTMSDMYQSLQKICQLPDDTQVYCAHEYTASNIAFALAVDPENSDLLAYRDDVNHLRAHKKPTIPTSIALEKKINPFLRTSEKEIIKSVNNRTVETDDLSVFTALREWKNEF
ncbi:hydroxyacylglutathione hydrolase [Vibrio sp.]|uniref:Hydroxyacylglutathione hydrolase n=1 Tax=Vibrio viridaestus TaxID=2487322 RepID=A0A3N9TIC2_9VIBR|nr:hydroxyacylglutathione hydrolase [Vibrio viridaestus]MDC0609872.1 hydroxyacylglutathione hydrolase [Vibrio sp.]RQW63961.1 hydroxyacylglutathione hydrolase [Vibrio viridaestus]